MPANYPQGASIQTGLGFSGFSASGSSLWEGAANVNVFSIEFAPSVKVLLDSWNMKTNVWLRECMYKRVTPKGKKAGFRSSMLTFLTSAVWVRLYFISRCLLKFTTLLVTLARCLRRLLSGIRIRWIRDHSFSACTFEHSNAPSLARRSAAYSCQASV